MSDYVGRVVIWPRKRTKLAWIAIEVAVCLFVGILLALVPLAFGTGPIPPWYYLLVLPIQFCGMVLLLGGICFIPSLWFTLCSYGPSFSLSKDGLTFHQLPGSPTLPWEAIRSTKPIGHESKMVVLYIRTAKMFHSVFSGKAKLFLADKSNMWNWQFCLYSQLFFWTTKTAEPELRQINLTDLLRDDEAELGYAVTMTWFDIDRSTQDMNRIILAFLFSPDEVRKEIDDGIRKESQDIQPST